MTESGNGRDRLLQTDHLNADLASRSIRGGAITLVGQGLRIVLHTFGIIVLARLLGPEAFGLFAMVAVVIGFIEVFLDMGLSMATVQRDRISQTQVSTLFWVNVALGVLLATITVGLGPALAGFYGHAEVAELASVLAVAFVIGGLTTQHIAVLRRQMRFNLIVNVEVAGTACGIAAAVAAAYWGAGFWALAVQRIAATMAVAIAAWTLSEWRPGRPGAFADVRELLGFGGRLTGSSILNLAANSLDQVLLGWFWGPGALGLYERAYRLLLVPITYLNTPLTTVAMPALSRLASDDVRYRNAYLRTLEKIAIVTMPAAAVLIATADWIVAAAFGPTWSDMTPIVLWLGIAALYHPIANTMGWLFLSQDRTGEMLRWALVGSLIRIAAVVAGLPFGAVGVAAAFAVSGLAVRAPLLFWMAGRSGPVSTSDLYLAIAPAAAAAAAVAGSLAVVREVAAIGPEQPILGLAAAALIAVVVTPLAVAAVPRGREALRDFGRFGSALLGNKVAA